MSQHTQQENCIFCKIVSKEIPSHVVWEDEKHLAFLDINPIAQGHTLLIPKDHSESHLDLNPQQYQDLFLAAREVSHLLSASFTPKRVGIIVEGFEVSHTHVKLIPINRSEDLGEFKKIEITDDLLEKTYQALTHQK